MSWRSIDLPGLVPDCQFQLACLCQRQRVGFVRRSEIGRVPVKKGRTAIFQAKKPVDYLRQRQGAIGRLSRKQVSSSEESEGIIREESSRGLTFWHPDFSGKIRIRFLKFDPAIAGR